MKHPRLRVVTPVWHNKLTSRGEEASFWFPGGSASLTPSDAKEIAPEDFSKIDVFQAIYEIGSNCLVPAFDGAYFSREWKEALWVRFYTEAPPRQRRPVERYNIVKRV
jgi:hypothetical protein